MKKIYSIILMLALSLQALAQCSTAIMTNNGTSSLGRGPSGQYMSIRTVYLITAAEMAAAGFLNGQSLTEIGWSNSTLPASAINGNLQILLENTSDAVYSKATNWTTATTGMTSYLNAATTLPAVVGPYTIPLGTPFTYSGGGIYVAFEWTYCATPIAAVTMNCNTALTNGLYNVRSTTSCTHGTAMAASSFRPSTWFSSAVANDAKVSYIYNQGEMAVGKTVNSQIGATITNNSGTAMSNMVVNLNISGANSFATTQTIANLPACSSVTIFFTSLYTPTNEGIDSVTVSIPADANNANNTLTVLATVDKQNIAYRNLGQTPTGGAGFNAGMGTVATKFTTAVPAVITHANLNFNTVTVPSQYRIAIYPDNLGVPGTTPIYVDAANRTNASGSFSVKLDNPVSVPAGTFYLGLQQMSTDNMSAGFISETPLRAGTFYFSSNPPVTWTDISTSTLPSKLLSGVRFCLPQAPNAILGPNVGCEGGTYLFTLDTVGKDGAIAFNWILPPGYNGTSNKDSISVVVGPTTDTIRCAAIFPCGSSDTIQFVFTSSPTSSSIALSNAGNTISSSGTVSTIAYHADGQIAYYSDNNCKPYGIIADDPGGNVLGLVNFSSTVEPTLPTYNAQPYLRRHFTITPASNGQASLLLFLSQADFNDYNAGAIGWPQLPTSGNNADPNIANIRITKVDGVLGSGPATVITPSMNWNSTNNYWEAIFPVTGFSSFYVHAANPSNQALPVAWQYFDVSKEKNYCQLSWATLNEINHAHYNVEHSTDGIRFNKLGKVLAKDKNGQHDQYNSYSFQHETPAAGVNYYRIEQVDLDGQSSYTAIKQILWGNGQHQYIIYPQPTSDLFYISASYDSKLEIKSELSDISGKLIATNKYSAEKGDNEFSFDTQNISAGVYLLKIFENNQLSHTQKLIIKR